MTGLEAAGPELCYIDGSIDRLLAAHFPARGDTRGAMLYVPPFAEEMNRARRMAVVQARAFADAGWSTLVVDLHGCGDSAGEFGDARWESWIEDLLAARAWLESRAGVVPDLWALRAGALLACELVPRVPVSQLVLWQPTPTGESVLAEFLRLAVAARLFGNEAERTTTDALRERLFAGERLEVGGYELDPALARALSGATLERSLGAPCRVAWFEVAMDPDEPASEASTRIIDLWGNDGARISTRVVTGSRFWGTVEITEAPDLVRATVEFVVDGRG